MPPPETLPPSAGHASPSATAAGAGAILLWSTTVAFAGSLSRSLGTLTAPAAIFATSGLLALVLTLLRHKGDVRRVFHAKRSYLLGCGALFAAYQASLYGGIGLAADRDQIVDVGIVNYLWPGLTIVFSVPILGKKARPTLALGMAMALAGVYLTAAREGGYSLAAFGGRVAAHPLPYLLGLSAAVSWALYSTLTRRLAGGAGAGAAPLFLLATGAMLLLLRLPFREESAWTARSALEVAYMAVFPTCAAYALWEAAMRRGNITLVAALSYFTPLLSTAATCLYLDVRFGWRLAVACLLVVAGAAICKASVGEG